MSMAGGDRGEGQGQRPPASPSDPWEFDPDADVPNVAYRGARRADVPRHRRPLRTVVAISAVLAAVVLAAVWIAVAGGPDDNADWAAGDGAAASDLSGAGMSPSATPSGSASASPGQTTPTGALLTLEAEAGMPDVKLRAAQVVAEPGASGGRVVRFTSNAGEIQIRGIAMPGPGTYRFTIYYAPGAEAIGRLAVGSAAPLTVSYASGSGCCAAATVDASVPAGPFNAAITLSTGDGAAPAIDRVVISRT